MLCLFSEDISTHPGLQTHSTILFFGKINDDPTDLNILILPNKRPRIVDTNVIYHYRHLQRFDHYNFVVVWGYSPSNLNNIAADRMTLVSYGNSLGQFCGNPTN